MGHTPFLQHTVPFVLPHPVHQVGCGVAECLVALCHRQWDAKRFLIRRRQTLLSILLPSVVLLVFPLCKFSQSVGARTGRSTGRAEQSHLRRRLAAGGANDGRPEDPIATCADLLRGGYEGASEPPSGEEQDPESPSNPVDSEDTPEAPQPKTEEDPPTVQLDAVTDELPGVPGLVDQLEDTKARLKRELQGSYPILETLVIWEIIETQATRLPTLLKEVGLTVSPLEQGLSLVTDPSAVAAAREARIARSKALILSRIKRLYSSCSELPNILRKARLLHHIGGRDEFPEVPEGAISQDTMKEMTDVLKKLLVAGSRSKPMQSGDSHWICGVFF